MGENSKIEWTHHTFNPWSGCAMVSPGCANCYAAAMPLPRRRGAVWGPHAARQHASDTYWKQPVKWDREAKAAGERRRVFCASASDFFEKHADPVENRKLDDARDRLFNLIAVTPNLDWLLLTKRPENAVAWWGQKLAEAEANGAEAWWPSNAWMGTSVENQRRANERIPHLLKMPAPVVFLSMEPLLGRVWLPNEYLEDPRAWVIVGGESGPDARPMREEWAREIRDACTAYGVPFLFKQWGAWVPEWHVDVSDRPIMARDGMVKLSKEDAGRHLSGRTWDGYPNPRSRA